MQRQRSVSTIRQRLMVSIHASAALDVAAAAGQRLVRLEPPGSGSDGDGRNGMLALRRPGCQGGWVSSDGHRANAPSGPARYRCHRNRRFGSETGQSPLDFLQQTRVDTAKRLLESPDHTITSVMEHVGYTDPASFRRLSTTRVGITPAAYRRQFRTPTSRVPPNLPKEP